MGRLDMAMRCSVVSLATCRAGLFVAAMLGEGVPAFAQSPASLPRSDGAETPVLIYGAAASACVRAAIFSHGLGGDEQGLKPLAQAMAASGWRVIVMGHRESGREALREAFKDTFSIKGAFEQVVSDPKAYRGRLLDLDAAYAEATRTCRPGQLILGGHSMGAATTLLEAGSVSRHGRFGRDRFDAYVALSPQGVGKLYEPGACRAIAKPVLMITGTNDDGRDGDWRTRLSAFEQLPAGGKRLAVIPGATHMNLGGYGSREVNRSINALTLEFLRDVRSGPKFEISKVTNVDVQDK
jgi:dienelactone hydrolase